MSENANKNISQGDVLKAFIENRYGSKVYEKYDAACKSGEIESVDDAASFLDKSARTIEGKLLTEPQLERHDETVIAEIRRLLGEKKGLEAAKYLEGKIVGFAKYFGVAPELEHEESKESGKRLTKNCVEDVLKEIKAKVKVIALAVGYAQSEHVEGKGGFKKLNPDYFTGLIAHIREHYGASTEEQIAQRKQIEEKLSEERKANKGLEHEKIDLIGQNADLVQRLERLTKEHGELEQAFNELRAAAEKYHAFAFGDVKQILSENKQGGKKNGK